MRAAIDDYMRPVGGGGGHTFGLLRAGDFLEDAIGVENLKLAVAPFDPATGELLGLRFGGFERVSG